MADFKEISEARKLLGLDESATLKEIKKAYRKLSLKYHPDKCQEEDKKESQEMFKRISHANDILMSYCAGYNYSFKEEDVKKNTMGEEIYKHMKRFYDDW